jgi:hypothetical protein
LATKDPYTFIISFDAFEKNDKLLKTEHTKDFFCCCAIWFGNCDDAKFHLLVIRHNNELIEFVAFPYFQLKFEISFFPSAFNVGNWKFEKKKKINSFFF